MILIGWLGSKTSTQLIIHCPCLDISVHYCKSLMIPVCHAVYLTIFPVHNDSHLPCFLSLLLPMTSSIMLFIHSIANLQWGPSTALYISTSVTPTVLLISNVINPHCQPFILLPIQSGINLLFIPSALLLSAIHRSR